MLCGDLSTGHEPRLAAGLLLPLEAGDWTLSGVRGLCARNKDRVQLVVPSAHRTEPSIQRTASASGAPGP